jgi:hypothetical protein
MPGLNHRGLWICDFPERRLLFLFFHGCSPQKKYVRRMSGYAKKSGTDFSVPLDFNH